MKKLAILSMTLGFIALGLLVGRTVLADGSIVDRAGKGIKKGGEAAAQGIDKGVKAAGPAIKKGAEWVGRGLKKAGEKIEKAASK